MTGIISLKFCQNSSCNGSDSGTRSAGFERHYYLGAIPIVVDLCDSCDVLARKRRPSKRFQTNPFKEQEESSKRDS